MKILKRVALYGLLAAVLLIGVCFPSLVGAVQDIQIGRMRDQVEAKTVQLKMSSNLSVVQKLEVVKEGRNTAVELESAQKMEYKEAYEVVRENMGTLMSGFGIFDVSEFSERDHSIKLSMYEENSVILWDFILEDQNGNQVEVLLDDDTGIILAFQYLISALAQYDEKEGDYDGTQSVSSTSMYEMIEQTGNTLQEIAAWYSLVYADYLGVLTSEIYTSKTGNGEIGYFVWMFDDGGDDACEVNINITDTELSVNF